MGHKEEHEHGRYVLCSVSLKHSHILRILRKYLDMYRKKKKRKLGVHKMVFYLSLFKKITGVKYPRTKYTCRRVMLENR